MKRGRSWWGWVLVVAAGCGGHAMPPTASSGLDGGHGPAAARDIGAIPPFAAPGEQMSYRLSLHRIEVGLFAIAVGDPAEVEGRQTIVVQAGVQSTGIAAMVKHVRTDFASWVDVVTGRPVLSRVVETAGSDDPAIEVSEARFHGIHDGVLPIAVTERDGKESVEDQTIMGDAVWDVPSILLYLRGWDGPVGTELTAQVVRSRYIWRGQFRIARRESLSTELGSLPTVKIDGLARRILRDGAWEPKGDVRKMSIWVTDDADRVPVLVVASTDFGDVRMEIVDYRSGHAANLRSPVAR